MSRNLSGSLFVLAVLLLGVMSAVHTAWGYQVIVDNTDGDPSKKQEFGIWLKKTDKWTEATAGNYGNFSDVDPTGQAEGDTHYLNWKWDSRKGKWKREKDPKEVRWYPMLGQAGDYDVYIRYVPHSNRNTAITYTVVAQNGTDSSLVATVDQTARDGCGGDGWCLLGRRSFAGTNKEYVQAKKDKASDTMSVDAVKFVKVTTNTAPVANSDAMTVAEGGTVTTLTTPAGGVSVLDNDTDDDGDPLTAVLVTDVSHGALTLNPDGTFSYTHDGSETTSDSFVYKANDGTDDSGNATVTITITPVNDPPVAMDDVFVKDENSVNNSLDVLGHDSGSGPDSDPDPGDTFTITAVDTTAYTTTQGTVVNNGTDLTYTPPSGWTGIDRFTYTITDTGGLSDTAVVTIIVVPVNLPPNANADSFTVVEDSANNSLDVLANDTDWNAGDTLTVSGVTTSGTLGTVTNNGTDVSYTPPANYAGADSFAYTVTDGGGLSDSATVTVTVSPVNDPPVALADSLTVLFGASTSVLDSGAASVLTNDTDTEGDSLTAVLVTDVTHGTLTLNSDGTFTYGHDGGASTADSFTYKANDGTDNSNIVTVTIAITGGGSHDLSGHTISDFTSLPLNLTDTVAPLVMIAASNDHQLYFKAYNDYSDLDGDNIADTTYKANIVYYGYFDSYKCYDYDAAQHRFEPVADAGETYSMDGVVTGFTPSSGQMTMTVTALTGPVGFGPYTNWTVTNLSTGATATSTTSTTLANGGSKTFTTPAEAWLSVGDLVRVSVTIPSYCTGANDAYWSGNFLNWIAMARIDVIRKILFGGHRRVDTGTETVLERTYLPHDAHSWAKHYDGSDLALLTPFVEGVDFWLNNADPREDGVTFCNTTDADAAVVTWSEDVPDPPLIKVAQGNFALWAGNERWQCTWADSAVDAHNASNGNDPAKSGIQAYASSPVVARGVGQKDYVARVQACVPGLLGHERCKQYPDGNYKPIGLLQVYGDDDQLLFGMVAGSYHNHVSGGSLIKNIESITNEINVTTDGTFSAVAASAGGPIPGPSYNGADGIINAWSLYRIIGYSHADGTYNTGDSCRWGLSAFADVNGANVCRNWGNPFSEIYFQAVRYFSDAGVTGTYRDNTSVGIDGLPTPQNWANPNPLGSSNYCARANIVAFNSSISSYDNDELDASTPGVQEVWDASVLPGAGTASAMTDVIGEEEGIHGNQYFVGEIDVDNQADGEDQLCTAKTVTSLGDVGGLCPESPRLRGSYRVAGISYYAHIKDIRADYLTGGRALDGVQKIDTYAVSNATAVPKIAIPHPITGGSAVEILPACRNTSFSPAGNCALVDFRIVSQEVNNGSGIGTGKFYVNWEDSEQGGDYDQDMWGTITYTIDGNTNTLAITTDVHAKSTPYKMGFGYILSGTSADGFHVHSGIDGFTAAAEGHLTAGADCLAGCVAGDAASTATYVLGASAAELLEEPLWYAAKWGGFNDSNGNQIPDLQAEWDEEDTNGNPVADGIPDNYFYATNPQQLENSLNRVFLKILQRTSSGTAAAVVSNNVRGEGALYQAYYEPQKQDANGNTATWVGTLHGLWLDQYGYLREDNGDGALGDYDDDKVIETYFDETENRTRVRRWTSSDPDTFTALEYVTIELDDIQPLWNAREQLYYRLLTDNDLASQRSYGDSAAGGRFIKTWIDSDRDEVVDSGEYVDFTADSITASNYFHFDMASEAEVEGLVTYLRGVETTGYRNRTVDYDGDGETEVMRLGDIVNSTPTLVGRPAEAFDLLYRDTSYAAFRAQYANRRNVLYVGANDGMLHAINAGFFDADNLQFTVNGLKYDGSAATAHPLGSELWAYVPMNLQPHLQWLKDEEYTHVYYMDAKPRVFDAKIFTPDADHPQGWGTVLVAGMRFGGGAMTIDTAGNGLGAPANGDDRTRSSAYVFFDITNPEAEPQLLAEVQPPDGSFTVVYPATMTFKDADPAADDNKWYLIFGSGPDSFSTGELSTTGRLYLLDLAELTNPGSTLSTAYPAGCSLLPASATIKMASCDTGISGSFLGTPMAVDWDLDYKADMVYFGMVGSTAGTGGRLMRLAVNENAQANTWSSPTTVLNVSQPVYAAATAAIDSADPANHWVYFGTGRLLVADDKSSTATQTLYGIKDPYDAGDVSTQGALDLADLIDVTDIEVTTGGLLINPPTGISTFTELETEVDSNKVGWLLNLPVIEGSTGTDPATRMLTQQGLLGAILFSSVYQPSIDPCTTEGLSRLYGLYFKTGTGLPEPSVFGTQSYLDPADGLTKTVSKRFTELGFGLATSPAIHSGSGEGDYEVSVFTQLSTGTIIRTEAATKERVRSGKKAWKER